MLPERLDRYQREAKVCLQKHREVLIYGPRDVGKANFIRYMVSEYLLSAKKVLLVARDKQSLQSMATFFRAMGISESILYYAPKAFISPELKSEFVKKLKSNTDEFPYLDFDKLLQEINAIQSRVVDYYQKLNVPLIYGKPWHELLVLQAFDKHSTSLLHYNHLLAPTGYCFDQDEFDTLLNAVKKAYSLVEKDEAFTDQVFSSEIYQLENAEHAWKKISLWIAESRKKMGSLLLSLNKFLENLAKRERKLFLDQIGRVKNELEEIDLEARKLKISLDLLRAHDNKRLSASLKTLRKENKTGLSYLLERMNLILDKIRVGEKSIFGSLSKTSLGAREGLENIQEAVSGLLKQIDDINPVMILHVRQKLDALNSNQSKDPHLIKLDKELDQFYEQLKENNHVIQTFENTAFSVNKKVLQLQELLAHFNYFESREGEFRRYFAWNAFYFAQDELVRKLIDVLLIIRPLDWVGFFRNWYLQNALQYNKSLFRRDVDAELEGLGRSWANLEKAMPDSLKDKKSRDLLNWIADKSNKSAISELKKKLGQKNKELNWKELFIDHSEFIRENYPFILTETNNLQELSKANWDLIVLKDLPTDFFDDEIAEHLKKMGRKILWSLETEKGEEIPKQENIAMVNMQGLHQQNIIPLREMNHTEKLYAARNLAYLLEDINPDISVYRMDEYIFFSCLSEPLNQVMEQLLDKRGIKKMRILESPFHLLVENLLEVKLKQILITQDALINNYHTDRIAWQLFVKERFQKAGFDVVDFKSDILMNNPIQAMIRFVELHFPKGQVSVPMEDENLDSID